MADLAYIKLDDSAVVSELAQLPGWELVDGEISKTFAFGAYLDGARFALRVAEIAENLDHHPNISIGWRKVTVSVNTHAVNGISPYDFELARRIEAGLSAD